MVRRSRHDGGRVIRFGGEGFHIGGKGGDSKNKDADLFLTS